MAEPVVWLDDGTPASARFNDRYRSSVQQGRLQAEQVFLAGCGLPQAWQGQPQWRILENGFGLGLNFLVSWQAWLADKKRPTLLHYLATEAYPVSAANLLQASQAHADLLPLAQQLARQFEGLLPGVHRLAFEGGQVLLTLLIGPAERMLRTIDGQFDSIYLDGFAPDRNPQMWEPELLQAIARRCRRGTQLASWTVARSVIDGLRQSGFELQKVEGVPPKRNKLMASYQPAWQPRQSPRQWPAARAAGSAIVTGAGLAGAAVAASLKRRGWQISLIDATGPAGGASGLPVGLLSAHVSPDDGLLSRWSRAGLRITWSEIERLLQSGHHYSAGGVLQRRLDATGALPRAWPEAGHYWSQAAQALPGLEPAELEGALWHARGGWVRPSALVNAWLKEAGLAAHIAKVDRLLRHDGQWLALDAAGTELAQADLVVLASASDCARLLGTVGAVDAAGLEGGQILRGQVSWAPVEPGDVLPAVPVNGHGHLVPRFTNAQGQTCWQIGASFDRDQTDLQPRPQSHADNLSKLQQLLPRTAQSLAGRQAQAWVGLRYAYKDHLPLIGPLDEQQWPGLWLSTAYGSRGLAGTSLAAELMAAWLHDEPLPVEARLAQAVWAGRVVKKSS
ncbi:MAG: FAD-dependent 5-carboxymethylaminomethyl-2-thiouridine(34) oxidoreductase MnmC [Betaproteobacteria bacterium]